MKVKIPFLDRFKEPMLSGAKTCTSRTKKKGEPGDTFDAFGATFLINYVDRVRLDYVARLCWKQEGATSMENFVEIWKHIHPRKGYDPDQWVYLHGFEVTSGY